MRLGITGGAGFIGANLSKLLVDSGHEVYLFDNLETGFKNNVDFASPTKFVEGDLRSADNIKSFFEELGIEYCVHLGALGSVPRSIDNPRDSFEVNALGTLNILEAAKINNIPVMFSSSSSVYGSNLKLPKIEKDWLSPISPYAASKLAAESLVTAFGRSFSMQVLTYRLFNVYGPWQNPTGIYSAVIPKWIFAAFKKQPLILYGNGEQKRDFTFVSDVVRIFKNSIEKKHASDFPVNLAFGNPVSLNNILGVFESYFGNLTIEKLTERQGDIKDSAANPESLIELHDNNVLQTQLNDGLFSTFDWFKSRYNF